MLKKIAVLLAVLVVLAVTNPSRQSHLDKISSKAGGEVFAALVKPMAGLTMEYKNLIFCSAMKSLGGDTVSFGILGFVIVL